MLSLFQIKTLRMRGPSARTDPNQAAPQWQPPHPQQPPQQPQPPQPPQPQASQHPQPHGAPKEPQAHPQPPWGMGDLDVKKRRDSILPKLFLETTPNVQSLCVFMISLNKFDMNVLQCACFLWGLSLCFLFRSFPSLIPNCFSSWIPVD